MAAGHDDDEEQVIGDGVDDAVVTDPDKQRRASPQSARGRWARVLRQQSNGALQAMPDGWVELS